MIFRELFLKGLTLLDLRDPGAGVRLNMSHIAARQEVRLLLEVIGLLGSSGGGGSPSVEDDMKEKLA